MEQPNAIMEQSIDSNVSITEQSNQPGNNTMVRSILTFDTDLSVTDKPKYAILASCINHQPHHQMDTFLAIFILYLILHIDPAEKSLSKHNDLYWKQ